MYPYIYDEDVKLPTREGYVWKVDGIDDTYEFLNKVPANTIVKLVKDKADVGVNQVLSESFEILVSNNTIFCKIDFRIVNTVGKDVTSQNGYLTAGIYIVKTQYGSKKIIVK